MSYPAAQLRQIIGRRLGGQCRLDLLGGSALTYGGDPLNEHTSCVDCLEACGKINATGHLHTDTLLIEIDGRNAEVKLRWSCPSCGHPVSETTSPLAATTAAGAIEADPLCFSCRRKEQG